MSEFKTSILSLLIIKLINVIYKTKILMYQRYEKMQKKIDDIKDKKVRKFKVGDLAVYPAHGVGRIEAIESRVVNDETHDFYIMKVVENNMLIMIPTWNVESVRLRDIISKHEISKVYDVIRRNQDSLINNQTWNRRYREYMDKIKTGSIYDVAEVFRDLYFIKITKDLSFGERKLFDTATNLLVSELSIAANTNEETMMSKIESLFDEPE